MIEYARNRDIREREQIVERDRENKRVSIREKDKETYYRYKRQHNMLTPGSVAVFLSVFSDQ